MLSQRRPDGVRRHAGRTAAAAAAVVAALLGALVLATDSIVHNRLVSGVDSRLTARLQHLQSDPRDVGRPSIGPDVDTDYDAPIVAWLVLPDSTVSPSPGAPSLTADLADVAAPATATLDGTDFRVAGVDLGLPGERIVVAASLAPVDHTMSQLYLAEAVTAPILVLAAFLGAFVVGSRVAGPVERARRLQLAFTADASHELRTPLSVVEAETSLALSGEPDLGHYRRALERVAAESERMRRLVEDLLWLARFEDAPAPPDAEPVDVAVATAIAAERFGAVAARRGLTLEVDPPPAAPAVVAAPPEWVDRLCGVLIDNACRYSRPGGRVRCRVTAGRGRVTLAIVDSGPGIPDEARERLFDRFHRGTQAGEGAGLGLAIGDAVVRGTGGRWEVSNVEGGARFAVTWPAAAGFASGGAQEPAGPAPAPRGGHPRPAG